MAWYALVGMFTDCLISVNLYLGFPEPSSRPLHIASSRSAEPVLRFETDFGSDRQTHFLVSGSPASSVEPRADSLKQYMLKLKSLAYHDWKMPADARDNQTRG